MKTISILGSTGSIGTSTLKVIDAFPDRFDVVLLSAHRSREKLLQQIQRYRPQFASITEATDAAWLREQLPDTTTTVVAGEADLLQAVATVKADTTVSAMVGAAGLRPTMAAIQSGSTIALANKEAMVVAGAFMSQAARDKDVAILPVDSEHNALHQCLRGEQRDEVKRLILTASGGPFRTYTGDMAAIQPEQALKHPTWDMGRKISIDSATMMNKGLEVIEAHFLFGFSAEEIAIVVHPQSVVHSLIETIDGSYKCQLGRTDMCDPIQYALTYPLRLTSPFEAFDITRGIDLNFYPPDPVKFPCIELAYQALRWEGAAPTVLNAANEITVAAFLDRQILFTDIPRINRKCLEHLGTTAVSQLDDLFAVDTEARHYAAQLVQQDRR